MDAVVVLAALILIALGAFFFFAARRARAPQPVSTSRPFAGLAPEPPAESVTVTRPQPPVQAVVPAVSPVPPSPAPLFDLELEPVSVSPPAPDIGWYKQFDARSGTLDDTARLRLIGDLGVIAKEWCVPLLAAAYQEERRPGYRQAALIALAACHSRAAMATFRAALASGDPAERAIASDGLADLEPPPQTKLQRTVERR